MDRTLHLCNQALLQAYDRSISIVYVLFVLIFSLLLAFAVLRCQLCCCCSVGCAVQALLFIAISSAAEIVLIVLYLLPARYLCVYPFRFFLFCLCSGCSIYSFCECVLFFVWSIIYALFNIRSVLTFDEHLETKSERVRLYDLFDNGTMPLMMSSGNITS